MLEIRSFRDLLRLFFIFRREFQWAVITTIVVAVLGAFLLPAKYESHSRLLVKPGRESTTLPIEVANRQALIAPSTQRDPILDEEKLLTGRPIVHMVAERYIAQMAGYQPQGFWKTIKFHVGKVVSWGIELIRSILQLLGIVEAQSDVERLAKKLEKNFSVGHEPGSAVMEISFSWDDPAIAQKVVESWVEVYLQERTRVLGRKSLYDFYENEMRSVDSQVSRLKTELQERLEHINSISIKERLENLTDQINRLTDARVEKLNDQAGTLSFLTYARLQLKQQPQEVVTAREISLNPSQLDMRRRLNALEQERATLLRTFLPDAAPVQEIEENIAQIKALVAKETERLERSKNLAPNGILVNLKQQIIDAELRDHQLAGQIKDYDLQLQQLLTERLRVLHEEPGINRIMLQLASAEKSYALYAENLEKARIDRELDNNRISNIALVEQATFNPSRVFPKSLMILLLAIPAGLAVGLMTLYLCYLLDQRVHDGGQLEEHFKVPLWTTLSDLGLPPWKINNPFTASLYRLYSLLPSEDIDNKGLTLALTSARPGEGVSFVIEHLRAMLLDRGHAVRLDGDHPAQPGEVLLLDASALLGNQAAFLALRRADLIALVIEAKTSTVPMIENALSVLNTAFGKVDGLILNRRQFEVPYAVLDLLGRWRGQGERNSALGPNPLTLLRQRLRRALTRQKPVKPVRSQQEPRLTPEPEIAQALPAIPLAAAEPPVMTMPAEQPASVTSTLQPYAWGHSQVLANDIRHRLLRLEIAPGQGLPQHYHLHRSKRWTVISGLLQVEIDGQQRRLRAGDTLTIALEQVHALHNPGVMPVQLYEVQFGEFFGDEDVRLLDAPQWETP